MKSDIWMPSDCFALLAMTLFWTFYETINFDELSITRITTESVMPAKAFDPAPSGTHAEAFRRGDE
jgi:hypothetical protein